MTFPWEEPAPPRHPTRSPHHPNRPSSLNKRTPLPPILKKRDLPAMPEGAHMDMQAHQHHDRRSRSQGGDNHLIGRMEQAIHTTQRSTKVLLEEALQLQADLDTALATNSEAWQNEKKRWDVVSNHLGATSNSVKSLSRELAAIERQLQDQLTTVSRQLSGLFSQVESGHTTLGFSQSQQTHVNAQIRDAFQAVTSSQQTFQRAVHEQIQGLTERVDGLSFKVSRSLSEKDASSSLGHARASGLSEAQAALTVRIDGIEGKLSGLMTSHHQLVESVNQDRLEGQEALLTVQSSIVDVRRAIEQERAERERLSESVTMALDQRAQGLEDTFKKALKEVQSELRHEIKAISVDLKSALSASEAKNLADREKQDVTITHGLQQLESAMDAKLAAQVAQVSQKIQKMKVQQKEQVQTLEFLADSFQVQYRKLDGKLETLMKSVVIV